MDQPYLYMSFAFQNGLECKFKFCNCKKTSDHNCQKMKYFKSKVELFLRLGLQRFFFTAKYLQQQKM